TPITEIAGTFDALVREGKVRYVAASNLPPERIGEWIEVAERDGLARPMALQPQYSLVARRTYEQEYAPLAHGNGLAVFPYYALARSFVWGKFRTPDDIAGAARGGSVEQYLNEDGLRVVRGLEEVAVDHGVALATTALAWVLAHPTITAPLASATTLEQLQEL